MEFFDRLQQETAEQRASLYSAPLIVNAAQGKISREAYLAFLGQAYHHVKHALPLLMLTGSRVPKEKEWVRRALVEFIPEETGHDDWVLNDIRNAGGDAEAVRNSAPSLPVELMNAFNYDFVMRRNPLGYFGTVVVLENTAVAHAASAAESIQRSLGLGKECFSYLESHGALDIEHTKFIAGVMNRVTDSDDQADILHATKVVCGLYEQMFRALPAC
jgi:pyrroloquinoline quinone (PQQ) biosynthesis protein C